MTPGMLIKIIIESTQSNVRIVENAIDMITNEIGIKQENYGKILVSTLEAVNNAIIHGNNLNPKKFVEISIKFNKNQIFVRVKDEGPGFKPEEVSDPTIPENIEAVNGRGVFLMSRLADKITFNKKGNTVTMIFKNIIS